jgi:hypothetical protein
MVRAGRGGLADAARPTEGSSHECWGAVQRGQPHPPHLVPRGHAQRLYRHAGLRQPGDQQQDAHGRPEQAGRSARRHRHHLRDRTILACLGYKSFFTSFENFIGVLLFFFVPWSAINLVDYYLVKRGRYDVQSFFTPDGIYGRIQ